MRSWKGDMFAGVVVVVVLFVVIAPGSVRCSVRTVSILRTVLDRKVAGNTCRKVNGSDEVSRVKCASLCEVTATCRGFTLTCPDLDLDSDLDQLLSACQCLACFPEKFRKAMPEHPLPLTPHCSPPPLIERTSVTHQVTSTHDVAHYSCSVGADVYVSGATDVTCGPDGVWPDAAILCAPTTCWYTHALAGPVYAGTLTSTADGKECQAWALNSPQSKNTLYEPDDMYPSDNGSKAAARNYCRVFADDYENPWCYWNEPSTLIRSYSDCDVPPCDSVPGVRLD